jgi:hypothetical protein
MDHKPITSKDFGSKNRRRTICQCHREIHYNLTQKDPDIERCIELLEEAYEYGIKMSRKLHEYAGKEWIPDVFS